MLNPEERKYVMDLIAYTDESIRFFSEPNKRDRERSICAAFLRGLKVKLSVVELSPFHSDPPDVVFRDARFEIVEVLPPGYKRHDAYRARATSLREANTPDRLLVSFPEPAPLSYETVVNLVTQRLSKKSLKPHYTQQARAKIDALVYVNLPGKFLYPLSLTRFPSKFKEQGWRSVSFLMPPYSHVICTSTSAPQFLSDLEGQIIPNLGNPDSWFSLLEKQTPRAGKRY